MVFRILLFRLVLLTLIPLAAALFLVLDNIDNKKQALDELEQVEESFHFETLLADVIHEVQKERGLSAGYLGSSATLFEDELRAQRKKTDISQFYVDQYVELSAYSDVKLQSEINGLWRRLTIARKKVFEQTMTAQQAIALFSRINEELFFLVRKSLRSLFTYEDSNELRAYAHLLQVKEYRGKERAIVSGAFAHQNYETDLLFGFREALKAQEVYERFFRIYASDRHLYEYDMMMQSDCFVNVDRIRREIDQHQRATEYLAILTEFHSQLGYGGFIHNFKNYIIRNEIENKEKCEKSYALCMQAVKRLQGLQGVNKTEVQAIEDVVQLYYQKIFVIEAGHAEGLSSNEIDRRVRIDDSSALVAVEHLRNTFILNDFKETPHYWWDQSTACIEAFDRYLDAYSESMESDFLHRKEGVEQEILNYFLMLFVVFVSVVVVLIWLTRGITKPLMSLVSYASSVSRHETPAPMQPVAIAELATLESALRRMNVTLQEQAQRTVHLLQAFLKNSQALVQMHSPTGEILLSNARFEEKFPLVEGQFWESLPRKERAIFSQLEQEVQMYDTVVERETQFGDQLYVTSCFLVKDDDGKTIGFGSISSDLSEISRLNDQLQHSERLRAVGELAGGIAHDFNNQLAGIQGFAEIIKMRTEDSGVEKYARGILSATQRSADMISKLLAFAKKGKNVTEIFDIAETLDETLELALHRSGKFTSSYNKDNQPYYVSGDATQIQNALLNIIVNALDAMGKTGKVSCILSRVRLDTELLSLTHPLSAGDYITVCVTDEGGGIRADVREQIFNPFFTSKSKGSGMGLAAVYGTMGNHHGAIQVESELGNGASFTLFFPAIDKEEAHLSRLDTGSVRIATPQIAQTSILIIDDEDMVREVHGALLREFGFEVVTVPSGAEGCAIYEADRFDIVLLDMIMPEMDGSATFQALQEKDPEVRVVVVSGYSADDSVQRLIEQGAIGFIQKPIIGKDFVKYLISLNM